MSQGPAPRSWATGPAISPPPVSIVTEAEKPTGEEASERHWASGIKFRAQACGSVTSLANPCPPGQTKPAPAARALVPWDPFTIVGPDSCSTFSRRSEADFKAEALRLLEACTPTAVETEMWTGALIATNPAFATTGRVDEDGHAVASFVDVSSSATPEAVVCAIADLEEALAFHGCGGRGMLHVTPRVFEQMVANHLVVEPVPPQGSGSLYTYRGNLVVPGTGYPGTNLNGVAPSLGNESVYATGMVKLYLGAPFLIPDTIEEALDRATNTVTFRAERMAMAIWDPCRQFHVRVDTQCQGPTGS